MSSRSDIIIPIGPQNQSQSENSSASSNYLRDKIRSLRRGNLSNKSTDAKEESHYTPQKRSLKEGSGEDRKESRESKDSKDNRFLKEDNEMEMEKPEKQEKKESNIEDVKAGWERNVDGRVSARKSRKGEKREGSTWKRVLLGPSEKPDMSKKSERVKSEFRRYLAEFHGTFMLVLIHAGVEVVKSHVKKVEDVTYVPLDSGLAAGLNLIGLIFALGPISGAHFNPSVTMAFFLRGVFTWWRVPIYWICQFCGGMLASAILYGLFGNEYFVGAPEYHRGTVWQAFVCEILATFILVSIILSTAEDHHLAGPSAALAVGATLAANLTTFGPVARVAMNPFRSLCPAIVSGSAALSNVWPYVAGPFIGAFLAVIIERFYVTSRDNKKFIKAAEGEGKL
jgi:MIP family channel proteins